MRNLKKLLEKIYRKAALQLVKRGVEGPKPPAEEVVTGVCRITACPIRIIRSFECPTPAPDFKAWVS